MALISVIPLRLVALTAVAFGSSPAVAAAADPPPWIALQYQQLAPSGVQRWGLRVLAHGEAGSVAIAIRRCLPSADACEEAPVASGAETLDYEIPQETPSGTSWEITGSIGDGSSSRRTDAFRGPVALTAAPTLSGAPVAAAKAPALVTVTPARWSAGGVGQLDHRLQVQACSDVTATTCRVLFETSSPIAEQGPADRVLVAVDPSGLRRLGAACRRSALPSAEHPPWQPQPGGVRPVPVEQLPLFAAGPLTAVSAFSVPVAAERWEHWPPTTDERRGERREPGATRARVRIARTLFRRGPRTLVRVRCSRPCTVRVAVRGPRRTVTMTGGAAAGRPFAIGLPTRALRRLGAGPLRTTVAVGGRTVASGSTRLASRLRERLLARSPLDLVRIGGGAQRVAAVLLGDRLPDALDLLLPVERLDLGGGGRGDPLAQRRIVDEGGRCAPRSASAASVSRAVLLVAQEPARVRLWLETVAVPQATNSNGW